MHSWDDMVDIPVSSCLTPLLRCRHYSAVKQFWEQEYQPCCPLSAWAAFLCAV